MPSWDAHARSLLQAPAPLVQQQLHPLGEVPAQGLHPQIGVDIGAARTQAGPESLGGLPPAGAWECPLQAHAEPRHRRFVQHELLQMARLHARVVSPERREASPSAFLKVGVIFPEAGW